MTFVLLLLAAMWLPIGFVTLAMCRASGRASRAAERSDVLCEAWPFEPAYAAREYAVV